MITVLSMVAVIWGIGWGMDVPSRTRWGMIAGLMAAVLVATLVLPQGHGLRQALGGDPRLWALVIGFGVVIWGYRLGLGWIKRKVDTQDTPIAAPARTFSDSELDRYARHMMLREIGGPGQKKLKQAKVLVIGAGGLGSPALMYLAAAGVGTIGVIDDDVVDNSNLQRQVIHKDAKIGTSKAHSAAEAMRALNPWITVVPYDQRLNEADADALIGEYDLVLDGTDNFSTRYLVNAVAVRLKKPLISAAMTQWEGQISLYDPAQGGPCYQCVFPEAPAAGLVPSCAEAGVLGPLPGIIGSMMAAEAVKLIAGAGESLRGRLMIYDALYVDSRIMKVKRRDDCPVCGSAASI